MVQHYKNPKMVLQDLPLHKVMKSWRFKPLTSSGAATTAPTPSTLSWLKKFLYMTSYMASSKPGPRADQFSVWQESCWMRTSQVKTKFQDLCRVGLITTYHWKFQCILEELFLISVEYYLNTKWNTNEKVIKTCISKQT